MFLSYGFEAGVSRSYSKKDRPDIVVDIFDMGESKNAFGAFSQSLERIDSTFGQGCIISNGMILFWKDRFYISILATPETEDSHVAIRELAHDMDSKISDSGSLPRIISYLPQHALLRESIRYFHHYIWMNSHYFISNENILNMNDSTDAVLAKYKEDENKYLLLLVEYPTRASAMEALDRFEKKYLRRSGQDSTLSDTKDSFTQPKLFDRVLAVIFQSPSEGLSTRLFSEIEQALHHGGKQ